MPACDPFNGYAGPPGLIDRFIGEQYVVVKAVYDQLANLPTILAAVNQVGGLTTLQTQTAASQAAAAESETQAAASAVQAEGFENGAAGYASQAQTSAQAALASANSASTSAGSAAQALAGIGGSVSAASGFANQAATSAQAASGSASQAQTQANASAASAVSANGSYVLADAARAAAVIAKAQAVQIAGFDPTQYALQSDAKRIAKKAALVFGS